MPARPHDVRRPARSGDRLGILLVAARAQWRQHRRSLLLLAAFAAATVGVGVALLSAADRAVIAFDRLRQATNATDAIVFDDAVRDDPDGMLVELSAADGVEAAGLEAVPFVQPEGSDYFPTFDLYPVAPVVASGDEALDTPVIVDGRAPEPSRPEEIAISEDLADELGVDVGDRLPLATMTAEWVDVAFGGGDAGRPDGPRLTADVVGLARMPGNFGRWRGTIHLTPAFLERYGDDLLVRHGVALRLSEAALAEAERSEVLPGLEDRGFERSVFGDDAATEDGLAAVGTALNAVAAVAILAGVLATALLAARLAEVASRDRTTLSALGLTRRQHVGTVVATLLPWLAGGVAVGYAAGVVLSPLALVGLARAVDPSPSSIVTDGRLLAIAAAVALLAAVAIAVAAARGAVRRGRRAAPADAPRRGPELPLPVPLALGLRRALFGDPERGGRASRTALVAVALGAAGALTALAVSASIARLVSEPRLTGQAGAGRVIDSGEELTAYDRAMPMLESDDRVTRLVGLHVSFGIAAGDQPLTTMVLDGRRGGLDASVVAGRMPQQPDEVALGPASLEMLDLHVGDAVELTGDAGTARFRVVGSVLFPEGDFSYDDGAAMPLAAAERVLGDVPAATDLHQIAFDWADGVEADAADDELRRAGFALFTTEGGLFPATVTNLGEVEAPPRFLAAFVGLLAIVMLAHALGMNARLGAREAATLRALGLTARGTAVVVATQALTLAVVALAVGVPLGVAAGRRLWSIIAERAHVVDVPASPWAAIGLVVAVGLAATAIVTLAPAWRTLRLRPADALRTE